MKMTYLNYNFSTEKNIQLKTERNISFDEVIAAIENDQIIDVIKHPNSQKYPHQELIIVNVKGYIYVVPFVEEKNGSVFLKTIYPSRKAKKHYLNEETANEKNN